MCQYCERRQDVKFGWDQPKLPYHNPMCPDSNLSGNIADFSLFNGVIHYCQTSMPQLILTCKGYFGGDGVGTVYIPIKHCPKCGCPLDITKQVISDAKKKKRKKVVIFFTVALVLIMILSMGIFFFKYDNDLGNITVRLIKKDFGNNISVDSIYYNSEVNGCIVKFSANGEDNTATVHLDNKTTGYQSVMDEYIKKSDNATSDEEKSSMCSNL